MRLNFKIKMPRKLTAGMVLAVVIALTVASELSFQLYLRSKYKVAVRAIAARREEVTRAKSSGLSLLSPDELAKLQKRVGTFKRGFVSVSQTAVILDGVSDQAERSGVKVIGVNSGQPAALKGEGGVEFEMGGAKYFNLPIKIKVEGTSRAVADFLRAMAVSSERIFVVDELVIDKTAGHAGLVTCDLTVSFFSNNA
jgi:Tfp pilus assembly protein PilO